MVLDLASTLFSHSARPVGVRRGWSDNRRSGARIELLLQSQAEKGEKKAPALGTSIFYSGRNHDETRADTTVT